MDRNWIKMDEYVLAEIRRKIGVEEQLSSSEAVCLLEALDELNTHFNGLHEEALLIDRNAAESQRNYEKKIERLESEFNQLQASKTG